MRLIEKESCKNPPFRGKWFLSPVLKDCSKTQEGAIIGNVTGAPALALCQWVSEFEIFCKP